MKNQRPHGWQGIKENNFHSIFSLPHLDITVPPPPPQPSHIQDVAENLHQLLIVLLADQRHIVNIIAELITLSKPVHTRKKKKKTKKSNVSLHSAQKYGFTFIPTSYNHTDFTPHTFISHECEKFSQFHKGL